MVDRTGRGSEEALEQARQYARAAGDPRIEADSLLTLSAVLSQGPRPVDEAASRAEAILEQYPGDRTIEAYMSHALGHLRSWQGRFDEARRLSPRYRDILQDNGQEAIWADSSILPFLAYALYLAARCEDAEDPAVRAIAGGQPLWKMLAQSVLARVRGRQGRAEEAEELARQAVESALRTDYLVFQGRTAVAIGGGVGDPRARGRGQGLPQGSRSRFRAEGRHGLGRPGPFRPPLNSTELGLMAIC